MKNVTLIISAIVFGFSGYYFISNMQYSTDLNYIVYMMTWLILLLISAIGVVYNIPALHRRKRFTNLIYNSYSDRRIRHKEFDEKFHILN
jgi:ABC-type multidrug transport system permease subunit